MSFKDALKNANKKGGKPSGKKPFGKKSAEPQEDEESPKGFGKAAQFAKNKFKK